MSRWDRFLDTFFNAKVMAKYLPDILSGAVLTIELALAVVVAGLLVGLILALVRSLGIKPINWLIIFVVDVFRSLPPLVVIVLVYFGLPSAGFSPSAFVSTWMSLALVLMAFAEEIFWAGITSTPTGGQDHHRAAHQPHHRHHQGHRARHRGGTARDPRHGVVGGLELLQSVAADDGRGGLSRAVPAGCRRGALDRNAVRMEEIVQAFFNTEIAQAALPIVLQGLLNTVLLSLMVVPLGLVGGLILAMLALSKSRLIRWPLMAWVDFFRAFPPLVLLILLFAGLPFAGLELGGFACVAIAFFLNTGAYYGEILRAGIESIPRGQVEAARSTGLNGLQAMIYVVLPQAVRNVLPDLLSNTLEVVKLTALGSVVAVPELLFQARQAQSVTYNATPIVMAAVIYFLILWPVVRLLSRLENRALHAMAR
jgi:polar amino acid transport system permease protein